MSFDAFTPTINESVWGSLMQQTSSVSTKDVSYKNAQGNWTGKKKKGEIRDAVKNLIDFWQHKEGQVNCEALDISIAEGNRLLGLEKNAFEKEVESEVDYNIGGWSRRKYATQMLQQYTNELESKRNKNCRVAGDKAVDYAEQDVQAGYDALSYTPPPSANYQQAGMGGNMMVYLTIGAIAFAGFFFIKSMTGKQGATAPAPAPSK
jgi:hypothetical protein